MYLLSGESCGCVEQGDLYIPLDLFGTTNQKAGRNLLSSKRARGHNDVTPSSHEYPANVRVIPVSYTRQSPSIYMHVLNHLIICKAMPRK